MNPKNFLKRANHIFIQGVSVYVLHTNFQKNDAGGNFEIQGIIYF